MKRLNKTCLPTLSCVLFALLLLTAGCAAPQSQGGLQKQIAELMLIQQQQSELLDQLQHQLTSLQSQSSIKTQDSFPKVVAETKLSIQEPESAAPQLPLVPVLDKTPEISAAAEIYLEAFAAIATGQMSVAEAGFKNFIGRFPDHEYSGNANYWMAEALLAQEKTKQAETILLTIIDNEKQQNKAPAAMARLVTYYSETNAQNNAMAMLQQLSSDYPDSPELKRLMRDKESR